MNSDAGWSSKMTAQILHGRFGAPAPYYLNGRPSYADALIRRVVAHVALKRHHRALDIGTGPGQLAVAIAPYVREVVAIDPEPEMLKRARANAEAANAPVSFIEASSNELGPPLGTFHLTTIGRAFHWTDRADTLRRLDEIIEPGGAVALFKHAHPKVPENRWTRDYDAVLDPYRAGDKAIERGPDWLIHEAFLLESAFASLERISVIERRRTPLQHFVDRALSLGAVWHKLDPIEGQIEAALLEALAPFTQDGAIHEVVESEALIATRP
jgi:SAM-dependent methyltransferase